jgi:hypothetical protein
MNYVYRLNLDLDFFSSKLNPEFISSEQYKLSDNPKFHQTGVKYFFNSETLFIKNIHWDQATYFQKTNGFRGSIHLDYSTGFWPGINIIFSGSTTMEYWHTDTLSDAEIYTHGGEYDAFRLKAFRTNKDPDFVYEMLPGVYLINASVPHRATGHGDRRLISLRSQENLNKTWDQMTALFQDLII